MTDSFHAWSSPNTCKLQTDVLVVGGGLAGAWAALGAARAGAQVVLVDKGYCGTSGVTATAGPGHWWIAPPLRDAAVAKRLAAGEGLADAHWMHRILDTTWQHLPSLAPHYPFPYDAQGKPVFRSLRGPEYMRVLRGLVEAAGVRVLDHSPVLELLQHADGSVAGARGLQRQSQAAWEVRAGAVVLATGGCAFLSRLLGADNNTGDGYLMAAEAGAELSGMEFSNYYTVAPAFSSMTRSMSYVFARYFDTSGRDLHIAPGPSQTTALASALLQGPVYCTLDLTPDDLRAALPTISPNVMLPFTRRGIDPFKDRFEVTLRGEGTVRGIGGLRIVNDACETTVPNLFAAGDTATRELVAGAISGGGNINSAWALSSGLWAGQGAAERARRAGRRATGAVHAAGQAGLRPHQHVAAVDNAAVLATLQRPMLDYDLNIFRSGPALARSKAQLDSAWHSFSAHAQGSGRSVLRTRETAALLATARWCAAAALARTESRGMHRRTDMPRADPGQAHRTTVGGLAQVWHRPERSLQPEAISA
ncbi:Succinate dehydrogenase/fumarate reductase, flavoprotein subunit [Rhodoferax sp. OV413]|uniref:FAD-dependent oxidoreductase n=1 Tax=Rhodoferax sp. OV413 TaxID=1855285 RepID=UPI000889DCA8|nr:FAD-binding protein [Rhodoferax sp. OV413]SDP42147.1 Succinate dehydrogenase/fumarate reductase, flavoprotein subunit [Rhodoferax sp. OV413]